MEEGDAEQGDMAFLKDLLSPGPGANDEFSREWQDAFGVFEPSGAPQPTSETANTGAPANPSSSSPTGFLPSQLLDHSLSSTGQRTLLAKRVVGTLVTEEAELRNPILEFVVPPPFRLVNSTDVPGSAPAASSRSEPIRPASFRVNG